MSKNRPAPVPVFYQTAGALHFPIMEDLLNIQDDNLGGLRLIKFTPIRFLLSLNPIQFLNGRDWISIYCTPETGVLAEQTQEDDNGFPQNVSVTCTVPKIREDVHQILASYRGEICVVDCYDQNGNQRRVGTSAGQVRLYDQSTTGTAAADLNNYTINFKGTQLETAIFI